ncbi:hypothetical protein PROFUN_13774 [Planoprotostelium fungivorum]|uniref:Uncharacterized protein n=1 Tax=Planoprotostelium fungivorum TaxID=1890364 RepID=A0A2P6N264_9EUKA|nr:hypothetical protein PROFUN_13774 [Planoprotostelium fungivorum]
MIYNRESSYTSAGNKRNIREYKYEYNQGIRQHILTQKEETKAADANRR